MVTMTKRIEAIEHAINGNSSAGLKGRVVKIEANMDAVKEDLGEIKDSLKWANRFVIGQTVALIVALLFFIAKLGV